MSDGEQLHTNGTSHQAVVTLNHCAASMKARSLRTDRLSFAYTQTGSPIGRSESDPSKPRRVGGIGKERHSTQRHRNSAGAIANGFSEPERSGGVALAVSWTGVV